MGREIDYDSIDISDDKTLSEYSYAQRRAELLKLVRTAGSPRLISQTCLSRRYDCSQPTISNDLKDWIEKNRTDRRTLNLNAGKSRALQKLLNAADDDWRAAENAWKVAKEWDEWLVDRDVLGKNARTPRATGKAAGARSPIAKKRRRRTKSNAVSTD